MWGYRGSRREGILPSGIRDNYTRGTVADFLRKHIAPGSSLSFVSAYFTIYAFNALKDYLLGIKHLRFLYGEPRGIFAPDPQRSQTKEFEIVDTGISLVNQLQQKGISRACADWIRKCVEIRSITRSNLLHGKMYHIETQDDEAAILGSSNFTVAGLGLGGTGDNIELNLVVNHVNDRRDLKAWFDQLWNDTNLVADVKEQVLAYLEQLYRNNDPQFIYYKTLFHAFRHYLDQQEQANLLSDQHQLFDTAIWKTLFEFQRDGVRAAINKILTYNGCILADSVGLGKTYEALAVIKYFELQNARVLVLCPKRLRENWTIYQAQNNSPHNPFLEDRFGYTVLSHTDLGREGYANGINLSAFNWGNFDLVVIDESHNFRNYSGKSGKRKSRYEFLMDNVIRTGVKTKVLLLSATPVNTNLSDLRNQLALIAEGNPNAFHASLGISDLRDTLAVAQRIFSDWMKQPKGNRSNQDLVGRLNPGFFKLLDELTIARSRRHIQTHYQETIAKLGGFPKRRKPIAVVVDDLDLEGEFMSYDQLYDQISKYRLSIFKPTAYVRSQHRARYDQPKISQFDQLLREHTLTGMMRVNFLKRLESSVSSFVQTLSRTIGKIGALREQIISKSKNESSGRLLLNMESFISDVEGDEDSNMLQVGVLEFDITHMNTEHWLRDLQEDEEQLQAVLQAAEKVKPERDAKLARLKQLIAQKVQQPTMTVDGKPNKKVLVFTAFADTAKYLYRALYAWAKGELGIHCAVVTGDGDNLTTLGRSDFFSILTNFAPRAKNRDKLSSFPKIEEIDLLIATDCISEGQNLQDCDYLVNYDIHWNPVRIIQRFGRIDRIGSPNSEVQLVNFWPTHDLNKYLNLRDRVEARMVLADLAATGDENLLAEQTEAEAKQELSYRDQQLLRLKEEVLDLEDLSECITLTEFTLNDFRADLLKYIQANRERLERAPLGIHAVVPPHPDHPIIKPGVIYCLQPRETMSASDGVNPLHPCYLVYVRDDGEVRLGFAQARQILEIFRMLCVNHTVPYHDLCMLFDRRTQGGQEMAHYSDLLERAFRLITRERRRQMTKRLEERREALPPTMHEQKYEMTDFVLVTWLVIMDNQDNGNQGHDHWSTTSSHHGTYSDHTY